MNFIDNLPERYLLDSSLDKEIDLVEGRQYSRELIAVESLFHLVYSIRASREAGERHAMSWRDFKVGSAVVGYSLESKHPRMGIFVGANIKPAEVTDTNIHAEQMAIAKLRKAGLDWVSSIAVWGETQEDHQSGVSSLTLHPCGRCRNMFIDEVPELTDETIIMSGNSDASKTEVYNLSELIQHHESNGENKLDQMDLSDEAIDSGFADYQIIRRLHG